LFLILAIVCYCSASNWVHPCVGCSNRSLIYAHPSSSTAQLPGPSPPAFLVTKPEPETSVSSFRIPTWPHHHRAARMASRASTSSPTHDRSPPFDALPAAVENGNSVYPNRRSSLGFFRRSKSGAPLKSSGSRVSRKMLKEQAREQELRRQREAAAVPKIAPRLPDLAPPPQLNTFGGDNARHPGQFAANASGGPIPLLPGNPSGMKGGDDIDPYARTESMTHRGRYSYASSAVSTINSPRRVRRRKDPTPYK